MAAFNSPGSAQISSLVPMFMGSAKLSWVSTALAHQPMPISPMNSLEKISLHATELTPHSETITSNAMKSLLAPIPMSVLMDEDEAKLCLKFVEKTVSTRATKRALAKKWTQTLEEAHAEERGKNRAAKRAAIGARAPKTGRYVDRCGCSHVF